MIVRVLLLFIFTSAPAIYGQNEPEDSKLLVAFYNVENLFLPNTQTKESDTAFVFDKPGWTKERYHQKLSNITRVLLSLGESSGAGVPDLVGMAEIENAIVLRDLVNHPSLKLHDYNFIHKDSPDERGIDVALLYNPKAFLPVRTKSHRLILRTRKGYINRTRDILVVSGYLGQELIHLIVNHWPSRRGGQTRSEPFRLEAARLCNRIIDSIHWKHHSSPVIIMGDFNDDPKDNSLYHILGGRDQPSNNTSESIFNPMLTLYRKGVGSLAYRDRWHLFDQILLSKIAIPQNNTEYRFKKAGVFTPSWLKTQKGSYKGYPLRTFVGNKYTGGYSDHFPVYVLYEKRPVRDESGEPDIVRDPGEDQN